MARSVEFSKRGGVNAIVKELLKNEVGKPVSVVMQGQKMFSARMVIEGQDVFLELYNLHPKHGKAILKGLWVVPQGNGRWRIRQPRGLTRGGSIEDYDSRNSGKERRRRRKTLGSKYVH